MKKHSEQEILLKLEKAAELMRVGKSQSDVCKELGVSIMTFHRWRKLPNIVKAREGALANMPQHPTTTTLMVERTGHITCP